MTPLHRGLPNKMGVILAVAVALEAFPALSRSDHNAT